MAAAGIVQGMDDGSFAPDKSITREEAAAILYRMAEFLGNKTIIQHRDAFIIMMKMKFPTGL